jgi:hypothetical protein
VSPNYDERTIISLVVDTFYRTSYPPHSSHHTTVATAPSLPSSSSSRLLLPRPPAFDPLAHVVHSELPNLTAHVSNVEEPGLFGGGDGVFDLGSEGGERGEDVEKEGGLGQG